MTDILNPDLKRTYDEVIIAGTAKNTRLAYARDLKSFWTWASQSLSMSEHYPIEVDVLIRFILERTTQSEKALKVSTIKRYIASISVAHQAGKRI